MSIITEPADYCNNGLRVVTWLGHDNFPPNPRFGLAARADQQEESIDALR